MVEIWLPYGDTETFVSVEDENLLGILQPHEKSPAENPQQEVDSALENPLGSEPLTRLIVPGKSLVLLMELTNPVAESFILVSHLLGKFSEKGIPNEHVKILLTTETSESIRASKEKSDLWRETLASYSVIEHDPLSSECMEVGKTSKGVKVLLNRNFVEADLRIVFSDISLHRYLGYRGGCSAILPGIAGADTIRHNHAMLVNPNTRPGVLTGNPLYEGIEEASRLAKVDFGLCIMTNPKGNLVTVRAGDLSEAFHTIAREYGEICRVTFSRKSDIVIASAGGSPYDVDLYHACEALESPLRVVKDGGAVILVAECPKGHGNNVFYEWMKNFRDVKEIESMIRKKYVRGGENAYYLLKAREKARIHLVSLMPDYYAGIFKLRTARTVNSALQSAQRTLGKDSKIIVLPYASMTLPIPEESPPSDRT